MFAAKTLSLSIVSALILVTVISCGQRTEGYAEVEEVAMTVDKQLVRFDIAGFQKKIEQNDSYQEYVNEDEDTVQQFGDSVTGYVEKIIPKSGYFTVYRKFFPDGALKSSGEIYTYDEFKKGVWVEYDEDGALLSEEDFDKPFTFGFEDVLDYTSANAIDLKERGTTLHRWVDEEDGPVWSLSWNSGDMQGDYFVIRNLKINGLTGEVTEGQDSQWLDN